MPRPEIARRNFEAIVDKLEYGKSVVWGDYYFASYSRAQAVPVDQAIVDLKLEKSELGEAPEDESARVEIGDVMVPKGLLVDLRFSQ